MTQDSSRRAGAIAEAPRATDALPLIAPSTDVPMLAEAYGADKRIDLGKFDKEARGKIDQIAASVPRLDGSAVNAYGMTPQQKANRFLDELLDGVRTSDVGMAGALVAEIATSVKMLDIPGLKREAEGRSGLIGAIPFVKDYMSAFRRFRANHARIVKHFAALENKGREDMAKLAAMDSKLDRLVAQNLESMRELELYVAAGQSILDREKSRFAAAREVALASRDAAKLAAVRDAGEQINGFESRLIRLHMAMSEAMLNVPQTRLTQSAGRIEYRNVADTLLFDIPKLKQAVIRIAALKSISDASKGADARRKLTQTMAAAGIEALDSAYTKAKESEGGALAEIAKMGEIADRILGIVEKGAEIDARNRETRREATQRLTEVKERFIDGLGRATANAVASTRE